MPLNHPLHPTRPARRRRKPCTQLVRRLVRHSLGVGGSLGAGGSFAHQAA